MNRTPRQYTAHHEPIWRERANFIVVAPLPEQDRYEQLWCRQLTESTFEVCCIPFFLYDVALGDVVETETTSEGAFSVRRVTEHSGRYVFRVLFSDLSAETQAEVQDRVMGLGGAVERGTPKLIAIDAENQRVASRVADYLQTQEADGRLFYETGRV